jgi:hypothetical protein
MEAMQSVRLSPVHMSDAEDFLAELWLRLEGYDLETPGIRLESGSDGMVRLLLSFRSPEAAAVALGRTEFPPAETPLLVQNTVAR